MKNKMFEECCDFLEEQEKETFRDTTILSKRVRCYFKNGYGISLVYVKQHSFGSYIELAVLRGSEENNRVCGFTSIANDVIVINDVEQFKEIYFKCEGLS